jgi:hypothetical protein
MRISELKIKEFILAVTFLALICACSAKPSQETATTTPGTSAPATAAEPGASSAPAGAASTSTSAASHAAANEMEMLTVPEGKTIIVRLNSSLGSKLSQPGDTFSATVAQPVTVDGKVAIPQGAAASGTVTDAKPLGRFKGGAVLSVRLNSVTLGGKPYDLRTSSVTRVAKGKGKRSAVAIGGGAGLGALIGGLAGGGKGAAIGAGVGAGAGTAGAAYTGNNDIVLPAESTLSFRLAESFHIM